MGLDQEVEVSVVRQRGNRVVLTEEPGVVALTQTLGRVINLKTISDDFLLQLVRKLVLTHKKREVFLAERQTKSHRLQLVLIIKELARGKSRGRVHFEALHYEVRKDFVVKLQ